jgi:hypothetical protein
VNLWAQKHKVLVPYRAAALWGFADTTVRVVIKPQFDEVSFFKKDNNLYYALGKLKGEEIVIMEDGTYLKDDFSGGMQTIMSELELEGSSYETDESLSKDGLHGYRITKENVTIAPVYSHIEAYIGSQEKAIIVLEQSRKVGIIQPSGAVVIPFEYDKMQVVNHKLGYAAGLKNGLWQIFDMNHKLVVGDNFDLLGDPRSNRILARKNGKYGFLDTTAKEVIPFKYSEASDFGAFPAIWNYAWVDSGNGGFFIDVIGREFVEKR